MIEAKNLSMNYGQVKAVIGCSFNVESGEIVGLLGPNGAGKSTIMKILATQIVPSSGTATIAGNDCVESPLEVRNALGYLPEDAPLYNEMEVREYLDFVGSGRRLDGKRRKERLEWTVENCGLKKVWCRPIGQLSKGYRQRVGLAQALIHDPPVLILDEPTSGLDPLQIIEIRRLVRTLAKEKAILFSTHILQEISAVSDRVVIINEGRILAAGTLEELSSRVTPTQDIILKIESRDPLENELKERIPCQGISLVGQKEGVKTYRLRASNALECLDSLADLIRQRQWKVLQLYLTTPDLEEIFTALVAGTRNTEIQGPENLMKANSTI